MSREALTILIVDDSAEDRMLYRRMLARDPERRYRVAEAESAADGLRAIQAHAPDCVLLDYRLPDADGIELLRRLPRSEDARPLAVIVLTGQGSESVAVEAMKAGAQDYIVKDGIKDDALVRAVRNAVEKVGLLSDLRRQATELALANSELRHEIEQRRRAEEQIQRSSENLERLVDERTAELSRANRLKDEFLATVSHELRTPLNAILGWSHVLREDDLPANVRAQALEAIERNVRWQANLIDDILDVSRIASGKLRLEMGPVDLAVILDTALDTLRPIAQKKEIALTEDIERPAPAIGDANRLRQVVWNLLSNSIKFTPRRGQIRVSLTTRGEDGDRYEVRVHDTGAGIAPEFLPYVFEPFRQADASPTRNHGGLGLGLAIVKQLVELSGGSVHAESGGEGHGAAFYFLLPKPPDTPVRKKSGRQEQESSDSPPDLRGLRVLVVDDDPDTRQLVPTLLAPFGATVHTAASAPEALDLVRRDPPDVLVTDLAMPGSDGYRLLAQVRAEPNERVRSLPTVALTAYGVPEEHFSADGFQGHVTKPFDPAGLARMLARFAPAARHPNA